MYNYDNHEYCTYHKRCTKDKCDYDCQYFDYDSAVYDEAMEYYWSER